jgi:hypothetical protein
MRQRTFSEQLFEEFCLSNGVTYAKVPVCRQRTPDYEIILSGSVIACEVKEINPNRDDLKELAAVKVGQISGRYVRNRLRGLLKRVSMQLKAPSQTNRATLLVVYDNTPFKSYTKHAEVVQAMFGCYSITVQFLQDTDSTPQVSPLFFGGNRGLSPSHNTAVSAIGILDGGPTARPLTLRLYHNPYARVRLVPALFLSLPVSHVVLPDAEDVSL